MAHAMLDKDVGALCWWILNVAFIVNGIPFQDTAARCNSDRRTNVLGFTIV
jgi:hypothetical protein